ncbi:MAG TPA: helicase C-terminal domain-containing protein, partial [Gemmiger formicilis]|nr:helicase C-terminal domain-containing protein [Gemmiger formicilis]
FPSYSYLQQVWEDFTARYPDQPTLCQESAMDEGKRAEFLAQFQKSDGRPLLGFAVLGGVFGEGVDLTGESLIGAAIVSPGLP